MSIRILLADDHGIIRQGLRSLLEKESDMQVVAEAEDGRRAIELVNECSPDIVVMDVTMPNLNGIEATRHICSEFSRSRVIALSIHSNRRFIADMLKAGAAAYILKECLSDELIQAIRTVAAGGRYLSPRITDVVIEDYIKQLSTTPESRLSSLTGREHRSFSLLLRENPPSKSLWICTSVPRPLRQTAAELWKKSASSVLPN